MLALTLAALVHLIPVSGGPAQQFSDLQAAIDAAADGDFLFLSSGGFPTTTPYRISGKGLVIGAPYGSQIHVGTWSVRNLNEHQRVVFQNCSGSLDVRDCAGLVWSDSCLLTTLQGIGNPPQIGARVVNTARAAFTRCNASAFNSSCANAPPAWEFADSLAWLHSCAGSGGSIVGLACGPATTGDGLRVSGGALTAIQSLFAGGSSSAANIGGGDGLELSGSNPIVHAVQSSFIAGGGPAGPGLATNLQSGALTSTSATRHELVVRSPTREGHRVLVTIYGDPGSRVFLHFSSAPALAPIGDIGALQIETAHMGTLDFGTMPAGGVINRTYELGDPGVPVLIAYLQVHFEKAGKVRLSNGQPVVVLGLGHWHP
jgi:hypothetical protein